MGKLRAKALDCQYKEYERLLTKQFISGLNDKVLVMKVYKEVDMLESVKDAMNKHILL